MVARQNRIGQSPRQRISRYALATVTAVAGVASVAFTLAQVIVSENPALAHRLAPYDGRITARLAASLVDAKADAAVRQRSDALARQALRQDPTAIAAVSALAINAQLRGANGQARQLLAYAEQLSRRNLEIELLAIEDAVSRDDVSGALRHYDIALRTNPETFDLLFPVLASASEDSTIRAGLIQTLSGRPAWAAAFLNHVAAKGRDPQSAALLFAGLGRVKVAVPEYARTTVIDKLIASGAIGPAWRYYTSIYPGADRQKSRDPRFNARIDPPSRFDWVTTNDAGISTSIQSTASGGIFEYATPASIGGVLLQQLQVLPSGRYRLRGGATPIDHPENLRPYWVMTCQDGRQLGRVPLPGGTQERGSFGGAFVVPTGCPVQTLALVAQPVNAAAGLSGTIDAVQLAPL
jgi:hypothetical protein